MRSLRLSKLQDAGVPSRADGLQDCAPSVGRRSFRLGLLKASWVVFAVFALAVGLVHATATYVYDASGRLRAVTNSTGASAEYVYDAMGNLLQVESVPAGSLQIFAFSPSHGDIGTTVVISGLGFSTIAANDEVKFNGTAAAVTAATSMTLTVTVPTGASTGKITVTVGSQTATSDDTFTVDTTGLAPAITSFSPTIGGIGTSMTVLGANLDPVSNQSFPAINGMKSDPTSVSETQIVFPVTTDMGTGPVSVTTPFGMGVSSADFFVTPPSISAANVQITTSMAVGGSTTISNLQANKYAAVAFNANVGSWLSFQASNIVNSLDAITYYIYDGHNHLMKNGTLSTSNAWIYLPVIPATGTYSIWLTSESTASFTLNSIPIMSLPVNGPSETFSSSTAGQNAYMMVTATANESVGIGISNIKTSGGGITIYVQNMTSGVWFQSVNCPTSVNTCGVDLGAIQGLNAGNYEILIEPASSDTMSFTATASQDGAGSLKINAPESLSLGRYGQTGTYTFGITQSNQTMAIEFGGPTTTPASVGVYYALYGPNQNVIDSGTKTGAFTWNVPNGSQLGTYYLYVQPNNAAKLNQSIELFSGTDETLAINNAPTSIATSVPGENAYLSFTTTATEGVGLSFSSIQTSSAYIDVGVYDGNNKYITGFGCSPGNPSPCAQDLPNLAPGTYQIIVSPSNNTAMNFNITLTQDASP